MERINLVELLKDCIGMELDCTIFDDVTLYRIDISPENEYPIRIETKNGNFLDLTKYGTYSNIEESKCVIFPKGKTTWEGFQRPFKDGDIAVSNDGSFIGIVKYVDEDEGFIYTYCAINKVGNLTKNFPYYLYRFATEKEKEKLFQAIRDNGYTWNSETKNLERFSVPKFKDGDILYCNANDHGENKDMFKYIFIFDKIVDGRFYYSHCHLFGNEFYDTEVNLVHDYSVRFATEDEKARLFDAIEENGYKWNAETKTLEKLPKFKVGDIITNGNIISVINQITKDSYILDIKDDEICFNYVFFKDQDNWELVPNELEKLVNPKFKVGDRIILKDNPHNIPSIRIKAITKSQYILENEGFFYIDSADEKYVLEDKFNINTLVPFESRVLVRSECDNLWRPAIFGFYLDNNYAPYYAVGGTCWEQCIPYEGNEHLRGKIDNCDEFFRTWEKTGN